MADDKNSVLNNDTVRSLEAQLINAKKELVEVTTDRDAHKLRADTAEGKLAEVQKEIPVLNARLSDVSKATETAAVAKEKLRADAAEEALVKLNNTRTDEIRQRAGLERRCAVTLGDTYRMDTLSDRQLRCAVLKKLDANADVSNARSDGEIIGRFDAACERRDENARSIATISTVLANNDAAAANPRLLSEQVNKDKWKKPLPNALPAK